MALNRLERWTRELLEQEARKRGVRDADVRSHSELVRAILRHDYASRHSLRNARKLFDALFGTATSALPRRPAGPSEARAQSATRSTEQVASPVAPTAQLAAAGGGAPEGTVPPPANSTSHDAPTALDDDRLEFARGKHGELRVCWRISDQGSARARAVLRAHGELALRVVSVRTDPEAVVCSEITDHGPVTPSGEWALQLATPNTHCVTAIGLRNGEHFVSIVHATSRP